MLMRQKFSVNIVFAYDTAVFVCSAMHAVDVSFSATQPRAERCHVTNGIQYVAGPHDRVLYPCVYRQMSLW